MKIESSELGVNIGLIGRIICYLLGGIFLLLTVGCGRGDFAPLAKKYRYNDEIRVIDGFFRGCTGTIVGKVPRRNRYIARITCSEQDTWHTELLYWDEIERTL